MAVNSIKQTFDTIPITVAGIYKFRSDLTGEGDVRVKILDGIPMVVTVGRQKLLPFNFARAAAMKGAEWCFVRPIN